jgi:hypothetical protein
MDSLELRGRLRRKLWEDPIAEFVWIGLSRRPTGASFPHGGSSTPHRDCLGSLTNNAML